MKLYIELKIMTFDEDNIEHNIINAIGTELHPCTDLILDIPDNSRFIKDTLRIEYKKDKEGKMTDEIENRYFDFKARIGWESFPLYEVINGEITKFDYKKYVYFRNTNRRTIVGEKISRMYNLYAEMKIIRKTFKYIMDELGLKYPDGFDIMNKKIEEIIKKNPKDKIK